jgi:response regulator RpfG family c-di-GMP phosphodiesterase
VQQNSAQKKTVMICDDEVDILTVYSNFLNKKFRIITAASGEICLSKYLSEKKQGNKIDVLLLDYRLGDMLGDEVACKIRDLDGTKTILISAYEIDSSVISKLRAAGCIVFDMKKPVGLVELERNIQMLLR